MSDVAFEILILFLLIIARAGFTMAEIAIVTARKSRLQNGVNERDGTAKAAVESAGDPNRLLSTLQVAITFLCVLAGSFAAQTLAARVGAYFRVGPELEPYSEALALAIVVIAVASLLLLLGEFVPKQIALNHPERMAGLLVPPVRALAKVLSPAVSLLSLSTEAVLRLFGKRTSRQPPVTAEEIKALVQQGTDAGVFEESEQDMIEGVFQLGKKNARAVMTPRSQMIWLDLNAPTAEIHAKITESGHSRFPVGDGSLDNVAGVVQAKDLLAQVLANEPVDLKGSSRQPVFVPRTTPAIQVLEMFKQSGQHIALVVDEYGGIEGLLTHHDILEAIAGEMPIGEKTEEPKAVQRHDGSWLLDGMLSVDEFKEIFGLETLPGEKKDAYQTLGGFLFTQMGRLPGVSDRFEWGDLCFEVVDMDGKRIDKVLITSAHKASTP